jgi:hypothetical protein
MYTYWVQLVLTINSNRIEKKPLAKKIKLDSIDSSTLIPSPPPTIQQEPLISTPLDKGKEKESRKRKL